MYLYPYFDSSFVLLLPAILLAMWAQHNVKSTFEKYSRISARKSSTAADVAVMLLSRAGITNVPVNRVAGKLSDHYDPVKRTVNLSESVYGSTSIASLGVAAHECGHAIQHSIGYAPLMVRNAIVPIINLSSALSVPLIFIGFILQAFGLVTLGILLFSGVVIFHLITLPVEFNASSRALTMLRNTGALAEAELVGARSVLNAAAWTYVATAMVAAAHLLRFIVLSNRRR